MTRNQWIVVTMLGLGVAVVCGCLGAMGLFYLTGSFPAQPASPVEPVDTPTPRATSTPTTPRVSALCQAATQDYLAQIQPLLEEWDDAVEVADSTARIALSPLVRDMQGIQRDVEDVTVPDCARHGSALLIDGMDSVIDSFIAFMGEESDSVVSLYVSSGYEGMTMGLEELAALAEGRIAETSTPVPTRVPPTATGTRAPSAAAPTNTRVIRTPTPTPGPPTPTSPPTPTRTPTQPPVGTRGNPVPRGQGGLTPHGWQVIVLDLNPDAWPVVLAENQFNDPPAPGNRMVIIRVGVTNVSVEDEPGAIFSSLFYFTGSRNIVYSTFGELSRCGLIPDELYGKLYRGSYVEGNICFQIPVDETDLRLLYEYFWDEYVYFKVQ
jgi:hypothetical protein